MQLAFVTVNRRPPHLGESSLEATYVACNVSKKNKCKVQLSTKIPFASEDTEKQYTFDNNLITGLGFVQESEETVIAPYSKQWRCLVSFSEEHNTRCNVVAIGNTYFFFIKDCFQLFETGYVKAMPTSRLQAVKAPQSSSTPYKPVGCHTRIHCGVDLLKLIGSLRIRCSRAWQPISF